MEIQGLSYRLVQREDYVLEHSITKQGYSQECKMFILLYQNVHDERDKIATITIKDFDWVGDFHTVWYGTEEDIRFLIQEIFHPIGSNRVRLMYRLNGATVVQSENTMKKRSPFKEKIDLIQKEIEQHIVRFHEACEDRIHLEVLIDEVWIGDKYNGGVLEAFTIYPQPIIGFWRQWREQWKSLGKKEIEHALPAKALLANVWHTVDCKRFSWGFNNYTSCLVIGIPVHVETIVLVLGLIIEQLVNKKLQKKLSRLFPQIKAWKALTMLI